MKEISPLTPDGGYIVVHWDGTITRHRLARRAWDLSRNGEGIPYAITAGKFMVISEHLGALRGRRSPDSTRYTDESGKEYVKCVDGHYEPAETLDGNNRLVSWYTSLVIEEK